MQRSQKGRYETGKLRNNDNQQQHDPSRPRSATEMNPNHASRPINTSSILALQKKLQNIPHAIRYQKAQRKFRMNHSKRPFQHTELPRPFKRQRATELIERNNHSAISATDTATVSGAGRNWKTQIKKRGQPFCPKKQTTELSSKQQQPHPVERRRSSQSWNLETANSNQSLQPSNNHKSKPSSGATQSNERDKNKAPPISYIRLDKNISVAQDNTSTREINHISSTVNQQRQSGSEKVTTEQGRNDFQIRPASQTIGTNVSSENASKEHLNQTPIRKNQTQTSMLEDTQKQLKQEEILLKLIEKQIQLQIALEKKANSKLESTKQQTVVYKPNGAINVAPSQPFTTSTATDCPSYDYHYDSDDMILPSTFYQNDANTNDNMLIEKSCQIEASENRTPTHTNKTVTSSTVANNNSQKHDPFIFAQKRMHNGDATVTEEDKSGLKQFKDVLEMMDNFYGRTSLDEHESYFSPNPNSLQCKNFLTSDGIVLVLVQHPQEYRQVFWPARIASAIESDRWRSHYMSAGIKIPEEKICIILYFPHPYYLNSEPKSTGIHPSAVENWWQTDFVSKSDIFPFKVQTSGMENLSADILFRFHRGQSIAAGLRKWAIDNKLKIPENKGPKKINASVHHMVADYEKEFESIHDFFWVSSSLKDHNEVAKMIKTQLARSRELIKKKTIGHQRNSNPLGDNATKVTNGNSTLIEKNSIVQVKNETKNYLNRHPLENNNDSNHKSSKTTMNMGKTNTTLDQSYIAHDYGKEDSSLKTQASTRKLGQKFNSNIVGSNGTTIPSRASQKNDISNIRQDENKESNTSCYQVSNRGNTEGATTNGRINRIIDQRDLSQDKGNKNKKNGTVTGSKCPQVINSTSQSAQIDPIDGDQQTCNRIKNLLITREKESIYHNTKQMYSDLMKMLGNDHKSVHVNRLFDIMTKMSMRIATLENEKDLLSKCIEGRLSMSD